MGTTTNALTPTHHEDGVALLLQAGEVGGQVERAEGLGRAKGGSPRKFWWAKCGVEALRAFGGKADRWSALRAWGVQRVSGIVASGVKSQLVHGHSAVVKSTGKAGPWGARKGNTPHHTTPLRVESTGTVASSAPNYETHAAPHLGCRVQRVEVEPAGVLHLSNGKPVFLRAGACFTTCVQCTLCIRLWLLNGKPVFLQAGSTVFS